MIKVHGVHGSPFVRKVLIALDIKGIPYEQVAQMPFTGDEGYRKLNPLGKIPTLEDGDLVIGDSKVICQYLEDAYPETPLYPDNPRDRGRARWLEELAGAQVSEHAAGIFFQRFMRPFAFKQEPDEELVTTIIDEKLPPLLDYLESQVPAEGFIFGQFFMADLAVASPFYNASYAGYEVDAGRWPNMAGLIARVKALPEVERILGKEARALGLG